MGSSLASVIIVNVRLCRDAFKGRFRAGVCLFIGGACEREFLTRGASGYSSQSWYLCVCVCVCVCRQAESSPDVQNSSISRLIGLV